MVSDTVTQVLRGMDTLTSSSTWRHAHCLSVGAPEANAFCERRLAGSDICKSRSEVQRAPQSSDAPAETLSPQSRAGSRPSAIGGYRPSRQCFCASRTVSTPFARFAMAHLLSTRSADLGIDFDNTAGRIVTIIDGSRLADSIAGVHVRRRQRRQHQQQPAEPAAQPAVAIQPPSRRRLHFDRLCGSISAPRAARRRTDRDGTRY